MTLEELRYFEAVVDCSSINKAAEGLFISRQGLSKCIERLESETGGKLFVRTARGVELTDFGSFFEKEAKKLIEHFEQMGTIRDRYELATEKTLKVLVPSSEFKWMSLFHEVLKGFKEVRPDCRLTIVNGQTSGDVAREILEQYDAVVLLGDHTKLDPAFGVIDIGEVVYEICVGKNHHLYDREYLREEDITGENFVTGSVSFLKDWLDGRGVPDDHVVFDKGNSDIKISLLKSGTALGFSAPLYRSRNRYAYDDDIRFVPMDPPLCFDMMLVYSGEKSGKIMMQDFIRYMSRAFDENGKLRLI